MPPVLKSAIFLKWAKKTANELICQATEHKLENDLLTKQNEKLQNGIIEAKKLLETNNNKYEKCLRAERKKKEDIIKKYNKLNNNIVSSDDAVLDNILNGKLNEIMKKSMDVLSSRMKQRHDERNKEIDDLLDFTKYSLKTED